MSALTSSFTANLVSVKSAAKKSQKVVVGVQASNEFAKKGVSFVAASVIALNAAPALAVSPIEIQDKRTENAGGLQLIYEARDLNLNQSTRGDTPSRFALQKLTTEQTTARAKEAASRLSGEVSDDVSKKYWTQAGNALRRAMYTLRFDVNNLVAEKGGDEAAAKDLFKTIESLDFAIRSKDLDAATPLVADAASKADAILASF